ncbi:MAG: hypothetical protein J7641_01695 [Cyanobacteria bacterium SID2]|nr:hypothetical protein [Cyanobacteria bacterium SID2]MBP0006560.1 hypothetical protein [Cyanobacteria bacterium SBC]
MPVSQNPLVARCRSIEKFHRPVFALSPLGSLQPSRERLIGSAIVVGSLAFSLQTPAERKARQAFEQVLIEKWQPLLNKECWKQRESRLG